MPDPAWNNTDTPLLDRCIHQLFESQVSKSPDAVALIDDRRHFSYHEINDYTNRLARHLRQQGVTKESIVGCYIADPTQTILCMLAIWKAGGTYLLFDAHTPIDRFAYIVSDAHPVLLLYDTSTPPAAIANRVPSMGVRRISEQLFALDGSNLNSITTPEDAAYIAYTSGSTGRPKGVIITHRSTVNHATVFSTMIELKPSDRITLMAPISFDMTIEETIPPLVSGCTLVYNGSRFITMEDFTVCITKFGYTILNIPAPLWSDWTEYLHANALPIPSSLRLVIAGSEEVLTKTLNQWKTLQGATKVRLLAAYGTTETTITSTVYTTALTDDLSNEPLLPIGKPIANTYAYILDEQLQQVPVGQPGELYIGGVGLARGYLHLDKLTEEHFITNPFKPGPRERLYRTGDRAKYRPDGNIIWIERTDSQIKLHGMRIEPAEIEAVLDSSPEVKKSVVVQLRSDDRKSDRQLVAFIVTEPGQTVHEASIRQLVFRHLPTLMAPQKYIMLGDLPLNQNGKIDRKALEHSPMNAS